MAAANKVWFIITVLCYLGLVVMVILLLVSNHKLKVDNSRMKNYIADRDREILIVRAGPMVPDDSAPGRHAKEE